MPTDLRALLKTQLDRASEQSAAAAAGEPEAVHDFRLAIKRLRALLRLVRGHEIKQVRRQAAALARQLGTTRDLQAAHDALKDLSGASLPLPARLRASLTRRLRAAATAPGPSTPARAEPLAAGLAALREAVEAVALPPLDAAALAEGLARSYRTARRAQPREAAATDPRLLHEWRKRVIDHRYQLDLLKGVWKDMAEAWIDAAQELRQNLGAHNDLCVLERFIAPGEPLARWRKPLAPLIARRRAEHREAAERIAARLFAEEPKALRARLTALMERLQNVAARDIAARDIAAQDIAKPGTPPA